MPQEQEMEGEWRKVQISSFSTRDDQEFIGRRMMTENQRCWGFANFGVTFLEASYFSSSYFQEIRNY